MGIRHFPPLSMQLRTAVRKSFSRFSRGSWLLIPYVDSMMSTSTPGDGGRLGAHEVVVLLPGEVPRVQHALPVDVYKEHARAEDVPPAFRHVILIPLYSMVSSNPMISMLSLVFAMSPSS